ncbi:cutinase [Colletotrichum karsti]|uniref:Cutinase n=1 Tax=Colletotrichum karsti TaxID=1095194 RepID=A0A9P6I4A7_9PEZI|nr:cutinase [Colletotrichum karsti]KAF9873741.1 cutinase [Colletotrichum karsti]
MRATTTTAAIAGLLAAGAAAQNSTSTCASGVHLIVARGSSEPVGVGRIGSVANGVVAAIPGSQIEPLDYPAKFENYSISVEDGAIAMNLALTQYNARCPNSKVALLGYSQGAHVAGDTLCGSVDEDAGEALDLEFNRTAPIASSIVDQSVIAVILFGDPTHIKNATWNRGTSTRDGLFPRDNAAACQQYASKIESWCDTGDIYCDVGNDTTVHGSYFVKYTNDAVDFVVSQFKASKTNGTSPAPTPSTVPASGAMATAPGMLMSVAGLSMLASFFL